MCRNIVDLQQTMSIMKRKRAQSELLQQHRPVTSKENLALIQLKACRTHRTRLLMRWHLET
jgi:hypothetical protein